MFPVRSRPLLLALFLCSLPAAAESQARSGDPDHENPLLDEARRAFAEGRALMDERRFREAIEKFRMAAQVKETPGLRYYVAYCLEQLGELVEAQREYTRSAELLAEFEASDVRELLPEAQERVNRALPSLTIVDAQPEDVVQVDGSVVRPNEAIRINPGRRTIRVTRGATVAEKSFEMARAQAERISVSAILPAPQAKSEPLDPSPAESRPSSAKPIVVWSGIGLATAGVGVGIAGFFIRESARDEALALGAEIEADTGAPNSCSSSGVGHPDCDALAAAGSRYDTGTALLWGGVIGGAVGISGALLGHFLWPKANVQVGGAVAPNFGMMSVRGRF